MYSCVCPHVSSFSCTQFNVHTQHSKPHATWFRWKEFSSCGQLRKQRVRVVLYLPFPILLLFKKPVFTQTTRKTSRKTISLANYICSVFCAPILGSVVLWKAKVVIHVIHLYAQKFRMQSKQAFRSFFLLQTSVLNC